jgi:hypothetical protein
MKFGERVLNTGTRMETIFYDDSKLEMFCV